MQPGSTFCSITPFSKKVCYQLKAHNLVVQRITDQFNRTQTKHKHYNQWKDGLTNTNGGLTKINRDDIQ